jgi:hypothetical protein
MAAEDYLGQEIDSLALKRMTYSHPGREIFRQFQAYRNPAFTQSTRANSGSTGGQSQWLRSELDVQGFFVIVQGSRQLGKTFPAGTWNASDIMLSYHEDDVVFGPYDRVMLLGPPEDACCDSLSASGLRRRELIEKEVVVRGNSRVRLTGIMSCPSSTAATGVGTLFTTELEVGDVLWFPGGQSGVVRSITSNTALVLTSALASSVVAVYADRGRDRVKQEYASTIDLVVNISGTQLDTALFSIPSDASARIAHHAPMSAVLAPGEQYAVNYRFYPLYEVRRDLGSRRTNGFCSAPATLVIPDNKEI